MLGLTVGHKLSKLVILRKKEKKACLQSKLLARKRKMGKHKVTYQRFVPNRPQEHNVRGQVPHKVPTRDRKGVAGSLPLTAHRAALPASLSGGIAALPHLLSSLPAGLPQGN